MLLLHAASGCGSAEEEVADSASAARAEAPASSTPRAAAEPTDGAARAEGRAIGGASGPGHGARPDFVGSARCAACHAAEAERWRGSHHDRAMEVARPETLAGAFSAPALEQDGARYGFERVEDAFFVTLRESGETATDRRRVVATFGVTPLQQLLVTGRGGRLHAWPIAWDARPSGEGGARWYTLVDAAPASLPEDPLHVDGPAFEWNAQCASCHSTDLRKGYDVDRDTYDTTWAEIDVGCEACHGPGREHVAWVEQVASASGASAEGRAEDPRLSIRFEGWESGRWQRESGARIATRREPLRHDVQLDVCAPCHARRATLMDPAPIGTPFLDGYAPRLMEAGLYFDDGGIRDEVYVWGSFVQSRMAAAGVRCSDCHDPHGLTLRREGNALCTGCHAPEAYDAPAHRGHGSSGGAGTGCVDCHMPARTYMGVDARRDHAFPMPRPLRSAALAASDPCRDCHADLDAAGAAAVVARWRGDRPAKPHWADRLLAEGRARRDPQRWAEIALATETPDFVRGGAWRRLAEEDLGLPDRAALAERLAQGGPLERLGLVDVARRLPASERAGLLAPLLSDARRAVRIAAAEALSEAGGDRLRTAERSAFGRALREYRAVQDANAERPESGTNLALLALRHGDRAEARALLERTIERAPYFVPARVNLADLARLEGDEVEALSQLREALRRVPGDARVRRAYAFALHRSGDREGALAELAQARRDAPDDPTVVLAHALALDGLGRHDEALAELGAALDRGLDAPDLHHAAVALAFGAGRIEEARARLAAWRSAHPADPRLAAFDPDASSRR